MTLVITLIDLPFKGAVKMSQWFMNKFNFMHEMFDTLFHFKIKYIQTNKLMFKVTYLQSFNANALNG